MLKRNLKVHKREKDYEGHTALSDFDLAIK